MLQFAFLRKADTYEKVRETCLEYADNQKLFVSQGQEKHITDQEQDSSSTEEKEKLHKEISERVDTQCEKFGQLALLVSK